MASFLSNIFKLTTGTVIAQVTGILLIPVITRLYSPEFFGVNQLFLSIATVIVGIASFSYDSVIMLPKMDEDSMNILVLCVLCTLGISVATGAVFIGFSDWFGNTFETPLIADYLILLPIYIILTSLFMMLNEWLSRKVKYGILSKGIVMNSTSTRVIQIGGGLIGASPLGLILGLVVGMALAVLFMLQGLKDDVALLKTVTLRRMKELAIRYKDFAIYGSAGGVANSMSWELPAFMLAYFFSPVVLGFYALAMMAVRLPMGMVGTAIAQVFYQKASEERNLTGSVKGVVREIHTRLISLGIFPFIIFFILAEDLFTFVFGADWLTAGTYARILAPWFFAVFIFSPISSLFGVLEKQKSYLSFEVVTLCTWALIFSLGGISKSPIITLSLFSLGGMLIWGSKAAYLIKVSGAGYRDSTLSLLRHLLLSVIVSLPLMIAEYMGLPFLILVGIAGLTAAVYYSLVLFTDTLIRKEVREMILSFVRPEHIDLVKQLVLFRSRD